MTNILQLHASAGLYGGESVILALSNALRKRRLNPIIGCLAKAGWETPELGKKAEEYGLGVEYFLLRRMIDVSVLPRISTIVRRQKIALIHAHGYKSNLLGAIAARMNGIPIVSTNHLYPMMPLDDKKLRMYGQFDVKITSRFINKIIAVSEDIRRRIIQQGVAASKVMVIENGIDVDEFSGPHNHGSPSLRQSLGIRSDVFVVGSLARLTPQKGQHHLLDAAAHVLAKNIPLLVLIAGDGPLKQPLKEHAENLGISDHVRFLGFRRDTRDLLGVMDVFVLSSIEEGLPMAMLEAMAARVPVITTSVGDIPKVIENRQNGMLVEPRNRNQLADALLHLKENPAERARLAANAYATVVRKFSQEAMCEKYLRVYGELIRLTGVNDATGSSASSTSRQTA